jgi:signal transduction histidine kinase
MIRHAAVIAAFIVLLFFVPLAVRAEDPRHVLILFPYDNSQPNMNLISDAMRTKLAQKAGPGLVVHAEFLDLINFPTPDDRSRKARQLAETYAGTKLEVLLPVGTDALRFALERRGEIAAGVPMVFCCADANGLARIGPLPPDVTGIISRPDVGKAAELAITLQPGLKRVVLVNGASPADDRWLDMFRGQLAPLSGRIEVDYLTHLTMDEVRQKVSALPRDSAIVFGLFFEDAAGQHFATADAIARVIGAASVPVYTHTDTLIGTGAVGGYMSTYDGQSEETTDMALQVLQRTPPEAIPPRIASDFRHRVDARALLRWGLDETLLPPDTIVLNRSPTLWQQYRDQAIAALAVIGLQSFLLAALLLQFARRKRAEQAMLAAQSGLARVTRMTTMGEMTASIAHEVNQPLAAIVANGNAALRWLGRATPDIGEAKAALQRITEDGMRAAEVIATVRAMFSDRGTRAQVDLAEVVRGVLALTRGEIEAGGIALRTQLPVGLPPVMADRVQLQQVVLNLVINAVEAMQAVPAESRTLTVSIAVLSEDIELKVADSGPGIDAATRDRVFEAFFSTKPKGMGMGLSICRSIIEAHGGRLTIAASDERGTTFGMSLPRV